MAGDWRTRRLGELADLCQAQVNPADTPAQLFAHYSIPAFDAGQVPVKEHGSSIGSHKFIVPADSVLVSKLNPRIPRVWKPAGVGDLPRVASTEFLVLLPKDGIDGLFLKYVCLSPAVRAELKARATGTSGSHQRVRPDDFLNIDVSVPADSGEQRAIAHILGTLDDKIELNRRMNRTLEEMARAIFKSWFVDFDPVRAKAAVRREHPQWTDEQVSRAACPKLKPEIAALFPDSFQDSELGEIPKGWGVGKFGDIVQIHDSKRIPLSSRERAKRQGPYRYYGAAGIVDYVDDFLFDGTYVLVGEDGSVVTDLGNPVVQYVWGKFWVNNHAHVLKAADSFSDEHLLLVLQQVYVVPFVTGAVQPKLSQINMNAIPILRAKPEVNMAFNKLIEPIFAKVRTLHDEIGLLAALRDALLPKLISGEIRVKDAERFLKERGL